MSRSDDLKNRLDELFSAVPDVESDGPAQDKPENPPVPLEPAAETKLVAAALTVEQFTAQAFQGAFENVSIGMILTGLDGRLLRVNDAFSQMLGYSVNELEGVSFQSLTHPEDVRVGGEAMRAMLSGASRTARIEKRYLRKDGQTVWVELNVALMLDDGHKPSYFSAVALDITRQHETATLLEKRVQELNCLNDIGHKIDNRPELGQFFEWIVGRIPAAFQHPATCIAAVEYQSQVYGNKAAAQSSSKIVNGLRVGGELVGWLHVAYTEPRRFVDAESALMGAIVSRISGYLENLLQQEELERRAELLVSIMDATPDWIFVKDRDHCFITVNQSFATALQRNKNDFIGKNDLELGFPEETVMGDPTRGIQGYWWDDERVLSTGEPQTILGEKNTVDGEMHSFDVFKTAMWDAQDKIVGLMGYARDVTEREHLLNEAELRALQLATVAEISTNVTTILNPQELLQSVVDRTKESFGLYHAHVYLLDADQMNLDLSAGANEVGRQMVASGWRIPLDRGQSLAAQAVRQRKAVVVNDVLNDPDFLPNELLPDTRSEMALPLIVGESVLGVLDVQSDGVDRFEQEDINIMTTLAAQVSVALQNARRYAEIQNTAQREHILREITEQVRASSNADTILRTAVRGLGDALGRKTFIRLAQLEETGMARTSNNNGYSPGENGNQSRLAGGES